MTTTDTRPPNTADTRTMPIRDITQGPRYRNGLGKLRDLQQSIAKLGLLRPVPVTADGALIVGTRRLHACQNLGWADIPVRIVDGTDDLVEAVRGDQEQTLCAKPMLASELVALGMLIEEIERPFALARRTDGAAHKPVVQRRQSRDVAADAVGMTQHYYTQIRAIALAALGHQAVIGGWIRTPVDPAWQERSRELLDLVDRVYGGEKIESESNHRAHLSINGIYDRWNTERAEFLTPIPSENDSYVNAAAPRVGQRKALTTGLQTLTGLCHGFASIDVLDPATTSDEAASYERDLAQALKTLRDLYNKIKEHVNATR